MDELVRYLNDLRDSAGWNQRQRILWALRFAETPCTTGGVCGSLFLQAYMPRYPVAVSWLRSQGHEIETGYCRKHKLGSYTLVRERG